MPIPTQPFSVNGRTYSPPAQPVVVICLDGCADDQLNAAIAHGAMPNLLRMSAEGFRGLVRGALPAFTNVNNSCIVTGAPPSVTGIAGNFFLDSETGEEVMMNSSRFLRSNTILAAAANAGRKVALVTAKEKLRDLLSKGFYTNHESRTADDAVPIAFSTEKAPEAKLATHGLDDAERLIGGTPEIYSAEASLAVFRGGISLLEQGRADFLYLTTTDYMQHKHAPGSQELIAFYAEIDKYIGRLLELGARIAITADHGMNAKNRRNGQPKVIYLETLLNETLDADFRVVCPITDPYVVHHGALGAFVCVHGKPDAPFDRAREVALELNGVTEVYYREEAARRLELPPDRIGDLVVLSGRDSVIGRRREDHDLSLLEGGLRSHGGRYEEMVPLLVSGALNDEYRAIAEGDPRNWDVFAFACNGVDSA